MKNLFIAISFLITSLSIAQSNDIPYSQNNYIFGIDQTPTYYANDLNVDQLLQEDAERVSGMPRAGVIDNTDLNLINSGVWFDLPNGDKLWRMKYSVHNALAVNLYFNEFFIPNGASLHAYSPNYREKLQVMTSNNNPESELYATYYVHGETIILEYYEPKNVIGLGRINIEGVNGFYDMINPLNERGIEENDRSGSCQIDVNCSEGDDWKKQRDATVKLIVKNNGQTGFCSGVLLNNTAEDCTPYILSAFHCAIDDQDIGASSADFAQWVFNFNYQLPGCDSGFVQGNLFYSMTGATKKAYSQVNGDILGSDYILLELNDPIDETKAPYFAGWNANNFGALNGVGIHHPDGDKKKISTFSQLLTSSQWQTSAAGGTHWRVFWIATANGHGVLEGGSSGSGIFNQDGLVVGQLTGGTSDCNDGSGGSVTSGPDLYGKMSYNWSGNENILSLASYLDPVNNGTTKVMQGNYYLCSQGNGTINGVDDIQSLGEFNVYPIPATDFINIDLRAIENSNVSILNNVGQVVLSMSNQSKLLSIPIQELAAGIYFIKVEKDGIYSMMKFVKQ